MIISSSTLMTLGRLLSLTGLQYPKDKCDPNPSFGFVMMTQSSTYFRKHKPLAMTMLRRTSVTWRLTLMRTTRSLKSPLPEVHLSSWPVLLKESDIGNFIVISNSNIAKLRLSNITCPSEKFWFGTYFPAEESTCQLSGFQTCH